MNALTDVCNEGTYQRIFKDHAKALHRFLAYKYGSDNNPADLVQEAFIKLWLHCKKVTPEKAASFLYTVATNQMLNELAKKKTVLKFQAGAQPRSTAESPEYLMEEQQYMERLQRALESLSEEQRVTFILNRVEGKKHEEIAQMLGISRKAVEKRIYTALDKIQQHLGDTEFFGSR